MRSSGENAESSKNIFHVRKGKVGIHRAEGPLLIFISLIKRVGSYKELSCRAPTRN